MKTEFEVKFVNVNHDQIREKLSALGAKLVKPMTLMRRIIIEPPHLAEKNAYIRIRDEGSKTTITYKQFDELSVDGAKEIEIVVDNFEKAKELFSLAGLKYKSFQESKRETWNLGKVEIVLDLWPWLDPYIEIEGPNVDSIKDVSEKLDFRWEDAVFGDVMAAYRKQYPHLTPKETVADLSNVRFSAPVPPFLIKNS